MWRITIQQIGSNTTKNNDKKTFCSLTQECFPPRFVWDYFIIDIALLIPSLCVSTIWICSISISVDSRIFSFLEAAFPFIQNKGNNHLFYQKQILINKRIIYLQTTAVYSVILPHLVFLFITDFPFMHIWWGQGISDNLNGSLYVSKDR